MFNINQLNKEFESRVRLGIMSVLIVNDWVDFSEMKNLLNITDGNLASHSTALGEAFNQHINTLEKLLKK